MNIFVQITRANISDKYFFEKTNIIETAFEECERKNLFRTLSSEYGRCTGKLYNNGSAVGWSFIKNEKYDDSDDEFLAETLVVIH